MGMYYDAYFGWGALVAKPPNVDYDMIEAMDSAGTKENEIAKRFGVGYMLAGNYDRDMLFIMRNSHSVSLGKYEMIDSDRIEQFDYDENFQLLWGAIEALGLEVIDGPGWVLVPDLS